MAGFYIGNKAPRTRRGQQRQIFALARAYRLTKDDLCVIASEMLGREVPSIASVNGFSDEEMFVLWTIMRGVSTVNIARFFSGSLDDLFQQIDELDESEEEEIDIEWLNF